MGAPFHGLERDDRQRQQERHRQQAGGGGLAGGEVLVRLFEDVIEHQIGGVGRAASGQHDDMIDTGGTIVSAAELLLERGAKEVWAMATHGVLSGPAIERLENSPISRVVLTNTLPLPEEKRIAKIEVLSVAKILADALSAVFDETSVSDLFDGENQS